MLKGPWPTALTEELHHWLRQEPCPGLYFHGFRQSSTRSEDGVAHRNTVRSSFTRDFRVSRQGPHGHPSPLASDFSWATS